MVKLSFYVPPSHLTEVKSALFKIGAGRIGNYDCCAWQTLGRGQFRPLSGSDPFVGNEGEIEKVDEYQVELVLEDGILDAAIKALKSAHPYEEPAYAAWKLLDV